MTENGDDRSPMSKAIATASQISTIGLMMILPALGGYYVDRWAGTVVLFFVLGLVFGVASSVFQLSRLVASLSQTSQNDRQRHPHPPDDSGSSERSE